MASDPVALIGLYSSDFLVSFETSLLFVGGDGPVPFGPVTDAPLTFVERLDSEWAFTISSAGVASLRQPGSFIEFSRLVAAGVRAGLIGGFKDEATWLIDPTSSDVAPSRWSVRKLTRTANVEQGEVQPESAFVRGDSDPAIVEPIDGAIVLSRPDRKTGPTRFPVQAWRPKRVVSAARTGSAASVLFELAVEETEAPQAKSSPTPQMYAWVSLEDPGSPDDAWVRALLFARAQIQDVAWFGMNEHTRLAVVVDGRIGVASAVDGLCWLEGPTDVEWTRVAGSPLGPILASGRRAQQPVLMKFDSVTFEN